MPRFTLIEVDNFPETEIDVIALPFYLQEHMYRHQNDIDFASEAEIYEAIAGWPPPRPTITRVIVEYKNIGSGRWQVKGLVAQYYIGNFIFRIPYRTSLIVSIDHRRRMYSEMLSVPDMVFRILEGAGPIHNLYIPRAAVIRPVANPNLNPAQSTHTASVHQTVNGAIEKLQARYQTLDEETCYAELKRKLEELKPTNFPGLAYVVWNALQPAINRLDTLTISGAKESKSNLTVKRIVALIWTAINDKEALLVEKQEALKGFIRNLYEIQRGGNLDEHGIDDGQSDKPICLSGTINKLVDTLNTIHSDVKIIFATRASASSKFPALVREYAINFIKNSAKKTALFEQIKRDKQGDVYPIPESVLAEIKENVEKVFKEEFASYVKNKDLDEILSSYEFVSFTENNFKSIKMLIYKKCEEHVAIFQTDINNLSEYLRNADIPQENKQKFERLNTALSDMLDGLIHVIKKKDDIDKEFYINFKKNFSQLLNDHALFSTSMFEAFHQQVLMLLNRLIEILSGSKIASISSQTDFFKKKQEAQLSLKDNFEYAIDQLPAVCNL